ncbi:NmrA-like family protein [Trichoderma simmonsii]|uniref:NmrA-like family protein n=1 Tax=Trichoderma simmonsii TaxID=1491479 RepID=A0A8G0L9M9_9HYPO|nr:NmrA-like family protein [Trichoderma simmonsii]
MAPTILIIGATGNTGKGVVRGLPALLKSSSTKYRVVALTRSLNNSVAKQLAAEVDGVEWLEKDWPDIDVEWLKSQEVERVFIAPHTLPHQFADESTLYLALLQAGVKYVIRVSTFVEFISPTNPTPYARSHWAVENLLSQPEFKELQWTSLQPNFFAQYWLGPAIGFIAEYKQTGKQGVLPVLSSEDSPAGLIDPEDIGNVAAHLLALDDVSPHNHGKYVLHGPEDVTGRDIVKIVEDYIGEKVENVTYSAKDTYFSAVKGLGIPEKLIPAMFTTVEALWAGKCARDYHPASKEVMALAAPKTTTVEAFKAMLAGFA